MKLTLDHGHGQIITIERAGEDLSIHAVIAGLVRPVLSAAGFQDATLDEVLFHNEEQGWAELDAVIRR